MLLGEYFRRRCGNDKYIGLSVTEIEKRMFKIPDTRHGWLKRIANVDVPDQLVLDVCNNVLKLAKCNPKTLKRIAGIKDSLENVEILPYDKKLIGKDFVYIMKNELGMLKVGISKTPQLRARSLATGSGLEVKLLSYYGGNEPAKDVEQNILRKLKQHIKLGEWFKVDSVSVQDIVALMPSSYVKLA